MSDSERIEVHLRRGHYGAMSVEWRGGATVRWEDSGYTYDGVPEEIATITGPGEYRVREWCNDDFHWGPWLQVEP